MPESSTVTANPAAAGRVYRSTSKAGLTAPGVALLEIAVAAVAALLAVLVTEALGWFFAVPFVLICGYCAWEVRSSDVVSALAVPPLVLLTVVLAVPWINNRPDGFRAWGVKTLTGLARAAPTLCSALLLAGLILAFRRWGPGRHK